MIPQVFTTDWRFYVRTFPCVCIDWDCIKIEINKTVIYIRSLLDYDKFIDDHSHKPLYWRFTANYIFQKSSQEQVYDKVAYNLVNQSFSGVDAVILSLGQTCSGKTYTTIGFEGPQLMGIIPRLIRELIQKKVSSSTREIVSFLSVVEICRECTWDLLATPVRSCDDKKKILRIQLDSEEKVMKILKKTLQKRGKVPRAPYSGATRGALVATYHIKVTNVIDCKPIVINSKIHCVDLPGVETVNRNDFTSFKGSGDQGTANLFKTFLEQVFLNLKTGEKVTHRSHRLITYLGKSLTDKSNLRLIGHIRPTFKDIPVTLSVLRLGMNVQMVKSGIVMPTISPILDKELEQLQNRVVALETEIMQRKLLYNEEPIQEFTHSHLEMLKEMIIEYTRGNTSEYHLMSITEAPASFILFKDLFLEKEAGYQYSEMKAVCLALEDLKRRHSFALMPFAENTHMMTELVELKAKIMDDLNELINSEHNYTLTPMFPSSTESELSKQKKTKPSSKKTSKNPSKSEYREIDISALQANIIRMEYIIASIYNRTSLVAEYLSDKVDEAIYDYGRKLASIYS